MGVSFKSSTVGVTLTTDKVKATIPLTRTILTNKRVVRHAGASRTAM